MKFLTIISCSVCLLIGITSNSSIKDDYKSWSNEDVVGVYEEISENEAKRNGFDESFDCSPTRFFKKVSLSKGLYEVECGEKIDSKFWGLRFSKVFIKFRYNPYLYKFDEGILDWNGYDGVFYKKP